MRIGRALGWLWIGAGIGLASCSYSPRATVRNATGADIVLWPLGERPVPLKAGETSAPILYQGYERQQALIERGGCLYTYPAPDYFALPKELKAYASPVAVTIEADMTLHVRVRSKEGAEGAEITSAGFPIKPTAFCGRGGGG